jgi:hypothetical protein
MVFISIDVSGNYRFFPCVSFHYCRGAANVKTYTTAAAAAAQAESGVRGGMLTLSRLSSILAGNQFPEIWRGQGWFRANSSADQIRAAGAPSLN